MDEVPPGLGPDGGDVAEESVARHPLSGQQRALYEALAEKREALAGFYVGGLLALDHESNPERFAQSAHSLRELVEKIPGIVDVKAQAHMERLGAQVRTLEDRWNSTVKATRCLDDGEWCGQIDGPLRKFLERSERFFQWLNEHMPRRRAEVAATLQRLDGSGRLLPPPLETLNVEAWMRIRDFFVAVAHHQRSVGHEEFVQWLDALERFLLERLRPRTFADFDTIDAIIQEAEGS